jgi:hypothetical protein
MAEIGVHARSLPGLPEEHASIAVWNSENWFYEDFEAGDKIRSIRRTISEGEAMLFNSLVMDHHPYVSDKEFAEQEGVFGKRLVAGATVFSYRLGLAATNCLNSFSYGYDRLRFIARYLSGTQSIRSGKTSPRNSNPRPWERFGSALPFLRARASLRSTASI